MRVCLAPYRMGSRSAKALARGIGILRTRGLKRFKRGTVLINWGRSGGNFRGRYLRIINQPSSVALAVNKATALATMRSNGVSTVDFTSDRNKALEWLSEGENTVVYGRRLVSSSEGRGIVILRRGDDVPNLPLYTKGVYKAREYRVHVAFGRVIDFTQKKRRNGVNSDGLIKNHGNGWVFCRGGVVLPDRVKDEAIKAVSSLGLDFGAVDVAYRQTEDKAFILEVNTACGLEGTTLQSYINTFKEELGV